MQRPTTASKPSPPPAESDERRLLREIAQLNYRTGMALVRNAKETLRRLDEADQAPRGKINGNPKEANG